MAHTGAGARMILLTLAWSLLTVSRSSGEVVKLVLAWRAQIIVCVRTEASVCSDTFCPV